jgi:hypothetical protein
MIGCGLLYDAGLTDITPEVFLEQARSFYLDLALSGNRGPWDRIIFTSGFFEIVPEVIRSTAVRHVSCG